MPAPVTCLQILCFAAALGVSTEAEAFIGRLPGASDRQLSLVDRADDVSTPQWADVDLLQGGGGGAGGPSGAGLFLGYIGAFAGGFVVGGTVVLLGSLFDSERVTYGTALVALILVRPFASAWVIRSVAYVMDRIRTNVLLTAAVDAVVVAASLLFLGFTSSGTVFGSMLGCLAGVVVGNYFPATPSGGGYGGGIYAPYRSAIDHRTNARPVTRREEEPTAVTRLPLLAGTF